MDPNIPVGIFLGFIAWFLLRYLAGGIYTVDQNERAVKTNFGRAERIPGATTLTDPISASLDAEEKQRYQYPQVRVIMPGGPYFKWPWQKICKVSIATQTVNMRPRKKRCSPKSVTAPPLPWTRRSSRSALPAAPALTSAPTCSFRIANA